MSTYMQDVDLDRFFNLLPFVSRMPRNQFFAELAGKVAHLCLASWSSKMDSGAKRGDCGTFDRRYHFQGWPAHGLPWLASYCSAYGELLNVLQKVLQSPLPVS